LTVIGKPPPTRRAASCCVRFQNFRIAAAIRITLDPVRADHRPIFEFLAFGGREKAAHRGDLGVDPILVVDGRPASNPTTPACKAGRPKRTRRRPQAEAAPTPNRPQLKTRPGHCRFEPFQRLAAIEGQFCRSLRKPRGGHSILKAKVAPAPAFVHVLFFPAAGMANVLTSRGTDVPAEPDLARAPWGEHGAATERAPPRRRANSRPSRKGAGSAARPGEQGSLMPGTGLSCARNRGIFPG
jgi:hypothetical protein